jgi:ATP phosphoribosyltransferase regulatory subunit
VQRLFLPLGTDAATGAKLRGAGWVTVAALDENDSAAVLGCTHIWANGQAVIV